MTEQSFPLASFYQGWDGYQHHLVQVLAPLSIEQLAVYTAPHLRSVGAVAAHIIGARARWLYYVLKERDETLISLGTWDDRDQPARSGAELSIGLEMTWQVIQNALHRWTIADLEETFRDEEEIHTRQWIIWHLIEHDLHHGGEISFALGMHGLTGINLL